MFDKTLYRLALVGLTMFCIVLFVAGFFAGILLPVLAWDFLIHPSNDPKTLSFWISMLFMIVSVLGGLWCGISVAGKSMENLFPRLEKWTRQRYLRRIPNLYTCYNNGVLAVVRKTDYERTLGAAEGGADLLVVSPTFTFVHFPVYSPLKEKVTGTMDSFLQLTRGAHVVELMPNAVFVPYTSGMMKKADEERFYPHIPLAKAEEMIWAGYKRPKMEMV